MLTFPYCITLHAYYLMETSNTLKIMLRYSTKWYIVCTVTKLHVLVVLIDLFVSSHFQMWWHFQLVEDTVGAARGTEETFRGGSWSVQSVWRDENHFIWFGRIKGMALVMHTVRYTVQHLIYLLLCWKKCAQFTSLILYITV